MKQSHLNRGVLTVLILSLLAGCNQSPPPEFGTMVRSEKVRNTTPNVPDADRAELLAGNTQFACNLYHELRKTSDNASNVFYSPHSISIALAMTYTGARTETEQQMAKALCFTLPQERLHPAFNALDLTLAGRGQNSQGMDGRPFRLTVANALWGQTGYTFLAPFLDTLGVSYGAGMHLLDFQADLESARVTINDWAAYETQDKIKELIPPGVIRNSTRLVLTNAVYFNAAWEHTFDKKSTRQAPFYLLDGTDVAASMMTQTHTFPYVQDQGCQAIELPYSGNELSMVILLPEPGRFADFEDNLTSEKLAAITAGLRSQEVRLTMPKFETTAAFDLRQTLSDLGMPSAFSPAADFSGMNGGKDLSIGMVVHKAYVLVNEAGTEAAAATGVGMELTCVPAEPVVMTIDRPFIFLIRDIQTGAILFVGRILNPLL